MIKNQWNPSLYEDKHAFVWKYGEDLVKLLSPQPTERILDLGCGTGQLTEKIANAGAEVVGMDLAPTMVEAARQNYPHLSFFVADAQNFQVDRPFDAVFSNAVLHWISDPDAVILNIHQALKPGGRFVAEFGGQGNVSAIVTSLNEALTTLKVPSHSPWYFPSIGEYATRLEQQGFDVTYAALIDRPTSLEDGEKGMENWIRMFANPFLDPLTTEQQMQVVQMVEQRLRPTHYQDGVWVADYRRICVVAIKASSDQEKL